MQLIRLATRRSALALWQTAHVADRLRAAHPGLVVEAVPMQTRGDEVLDRPLAELGGKGLFLKELEVAMLERRADAAVHSLKDVPMDLEAGFMLAAVLPRGDPFDAFVSDRHARLEALPHGARVGTSSLRRQAQLRGQRPDLELHDLRGNVNSRIARLDAGEYDAIVLACAGLQRLDLGARIRSRLEFPQWVPAVAQGAIAVECRAGDDATAALFAPLGDPDTAVRVGAERAMNRHLHGSCHVPVAGYATLGSGRLQLTGLVGDVVSGRCLRAEASGGAGDGESLGVEVAEALLAQGAGALLAR